MLQQLWDLREKVRQERPLVYNLTNNVVTNVTANILLAAGARPIMSEGAAEAEALARAADALVLNIGTLHTRQITYFLKAGSYANEYGKPVVLEEGKAAPIIAMGKADAVYLQSIGRVRIIATEEVAKSARAKKAKAE